MLYHANSLSNTKDRGIKVQGLYALFMHCHGVTVISYNYSDIERHDSIHYLCWRTGEHERFLCN